MHVETVKVKSEVSEDNPLGYVVINKEDFIEGEHELYEEAETEAKVTGTSGILEPQPQGASEATSQTPAANTAKPWASQ